MKPLLAYHVKFYIKGNIWRTVQVTLPKFVLDLSFVVLCISFIKFGWYKLKLKNENEKVSMFFYLQSGINPQNLVTPPKLELDLILWWKPLCTRFIAFRRGKLKLENGNEKFIPIVKEHNSRMIRVTPSPPNSNFICILWYFCISFTAFGWGKLKLENGTKKFSNFSICERT